MFVLAEGNNAGDARPAIVIKAMDHPVNSCNLRVFTDGPNDTVNGPIDTWKQSVAYDPYKAQGTWHWPNQVAVVEEVGPATDEPFD